MQTFWDDLDLMHAITRIFVWVAVVLLLVASVGWVLQRPYFSINQFRFVGDVAQLEPQPTHKLIQENLDQGLSGGFFSMNLRQVQGSLHQFSWVKNTTVRRVWPHQIEINLTAFTPLAVWKNRYLSPEGQLFDTRLDDAQKSRLIHAEGPDAASQLVATQIPHLQEKLAPMGLKLNKVVLTERYSWRVWLEGGLEVELGRADTPSALDERMARLVESAQFVKENANSGGYIDLRYPNGFAMRSAKLHRTSTETMTEITVNQNESKQP